MKKLFTQLSALCCLFCINLAQALPTREGEVIFESPNSLHYSCRISEVVASHGSSTIREVAVWEGIYNLEQPLTPSFFGASRTFDLKTSAGKRRLFAWNVLTLSDREKRKSSKGLCTVQLFMADMSTADPNATSANSHFRAPHGDDAFPPQCQPLPFVRDYSFSQYLSAVALSESVRLTMSCDFTPK